LHSLIQNVALVVETLLLLSLTAIELSLDFSEMSSNSVFVILTDKVYQAVNFVQISIQIIESILEIGLKEKYLVTKGVVYRLKIAQVFQSLLCPSAF